MVRRPTIFDSSTAVTVEAVVMSSADPYFDGDGSFVLLTAARNKNVIVQLKRQCKSSGYAVMRCTLTVGDYLAIESGRSSCGDADRCEAGDKVGRRR